MPKPFSTLDMVGQLIQYSAILPILAIGWLTLSPRSGIQRIEDYIVLVAALLFGSMVTYALGGLVRLQVTKYDALVLITEQLHTLVKERSK